METELVELLQNYENKNLFNQEGILSDSDLLAILNDLKEFNENSQNETLQQNNTEEHNQVILQNNTEQTESINCTTVVQIGTIDQFNRDIKLIDFLTKKCSELGTSFLVMSKSFTSMPFVFSYFMEATYKDNLNDNIFKGRVLSYEDYLNNFSSIIKDFNEGKSISKNFCFIYFCTLSTYDSIKNSDFVNSFIKTIYFI